MPITYVNTNELLATHSSEYLPHAYAYMHPITGYKRPPFTFSTIREMQIHPDVMFAMWLLKGPMLARARMQVECDNEEVKQYVIRALNRFWKNGAVQALKALEWGFSCSEVLWKADNKGMISYSKLRDFETEACRIVTQGGERVGVLVKNFSTFGGETTKELYLGGPKVFHHVHSREKHLWYGQSRLIGAHLPWNEMMTEGGYRDIRRMWFYKNAFQGGIMRHPDGYVRTPEGNLKAYQHIAQEMIEKMRTGAVLAIPSKYDARGNPIWDFEAPKGNTIPAGLFEYGNDLKDEILEGVGIPTEVIRSGGNQGFGSASGREVPESAFYANLQDLLNWLVLDFDEQIINPGYQINAHLGKLQSNVEYEINIHPLDVDAAEMDYEEDLEEEPSSTDPNNQPSNEPKKKPQTQSEGPTRRLVVAA